ncbi:MAG: cohesin domain-containing protein [Candidatus Sumerlaeia bacterium]|nr:cohesin domain-containing protein [Candidatus Sumerlaeia bacterium]
MNPRILAATALALAAALTPAAAQVVQREAGDTPVPRTVLRKDEKMREHERRIREIIRQRQDEARKRAEAERAVQPPGDVPVAEATPADAPPDAAPKEARALGAVMLYYNFPEPESPRQLDTAVRSGQEFVSEVVMLNDAAADITGVRLALAYDKRFLEPVRVFDSQLRPLLAEEPSFEIDSREGVVYYTATLRSPLSATEFVPVRVLWKALRPTSYTNLNFVFQTESREGSELTAVLQDERNILGVGFDPIDGVLGGGVVVDPPEGRERRLQGKADELRAMYLDTIAAHANAGLVLRGPKESPRTGDIFPVEVALNNPEGTLIDSVDFTLSWDPTALELVDADRGNWIRRGINANDGPFRADYPFNYFKSNEGRNDRGQLRYSAGMTEGASLPTGTFAVVYFRALRPTTGTMVEFLRSRPGEANLTSIRYFGYEIGDLGEALSRTAVALGIANAPEGHTPVDARPARSPEPAPAADTPAPAAGETLIRRP